MPELQYLTFRIDQEVYGIEVANAREVIEVSSLTPMPKAPNWIRGVVNLRGNILPVLDLRRKFNMGETQLGERAYVVVVELPLDDDTLLVGVLVDSALEVFEYPQAQIEPPPKFGARFSRGYLRGVGRREKYLFFVLDAAQVFSDAEPIVLEAEADEPSDRGSQTESEAEIAHG